MGNRSTESLFPKKGKAMKGPSPLRSEVGLKHLAPKVDDIENAYHELTDKGVKSSFPPSLAEGGPKIAFLEDPDGVVIELIRWQ